MIVQACMLGYKRRVPVAAFLLMVTLLAVIGMLRLQVDTGIDSLIPADDPARVIYQKVMGEFGTDNKTIIYIKDENLWTPEKLLHLEQLHLAIEKTQGVSRVDGIFSLHTIHGVDGKIVSRPVLRSAPKTVEEALSAKESALANPLYLGNFFSEDGNVTAMIVSIVDADDRNNFSREIYQALEDHINVHLSEFEYITQVGPPRINAELKQSLYEDFMLLGPLSAVILVLSILIFMRSWLSAIVPLVTSIITIIWTFGFLGWVGIPLNILSAMIPSLIIVIGSTEDTHLMAAFLRGLDENKDQADARKHAVKYMAKHIGLPLVLTVLTTALGFASNLFSNIGLIQHFSIAATFAMLANGFITVLVLPLMLSIFASDKNTSLVKDKETNSVPNRLMRIFRYSQDHFPLSTLMMTAALCLFFVFQASKLYVTNDPLSYFQSDRPLIQDVKRIHEDLAGVKIFFISLESKHAKAFQEPKNIKKLSDIQDFLDSQGVYDRSISLADHLKFINREFRNSGIEDSIPETRKLIAQYLMFFHRSDLDSYVSHDYSRANIVVRHNITDSHSLNKYIRELEDVMKEIAGSHMTSHIVSENLMVNHAAESLMVAQVKALVILLTLIFLIMSAMFTSFKGGLIALVPAIIPITLMFGIMGYLDIPLNPGTAMVAVIAIGIAIDGTIHLLARYNELCRYTSDYIEAVNTAVREEATPLIVSSIALALGFGVLIFSNFTIVAQFGALAAATMLFSIFANLLITPIIMSRIRLVGLYQILAMSVDRDVLDGSPLLQNMTDYQRRKAILISELNEFKKGDLLVEQGSIGRDMYLILSGKAEVVRKDDGESRSLAILMPGQVFGEIGYIRETERTADVVAIDDVSVLRFDYERMQDDLKFFPNIVAKLNFNICYILGQRLADMVASSKNK
ncbi:MAG TPA: cyclic nucleotide-binding domain-containing protein [Thiotrichaceae bacterium]|nr:cyclic nucleotide-binding domain-containing protein [Thiotrichaceae bacterium]HIM07543.1 cyclic nucleotide-binding domain-containing protein [Gammaproteobacteria bacterium]